MQNNNELENLKQISKMIAKEFGENCEVVLHDWSKDYDQTIVAIENGHVTGRKIGDSGSNLGLLVMGKEKSEDSDYMYNYVTKTKDGKILRSSTAYLKGEDGEYMSALCVNYDITDLLKIEKTIQSISLSPTLLENEDSELFANNVSEILDFLSIKCIEHIGKPVSEMSKDDKVDAVSFFDSKGGFLISKSNEYIREFLDITKYALYQYLEISRSKNE